MTIEALLTRYPMLLVALPLLGFVLGTLISWQLWHFLASRRARSSQGRGRRAEKKAVRLLKKNGFRILETAPSITSSLLVDDVPRRFTVTPDFLATRDGQTYVVEVKRYRAGNSINNAGIRRQVLEYLIAAELPCLLIAMPEGSIEEIDLPEPA